MADVNQLLYKNIAAQVIKLILQSSLIMPCDEEDSNSSDGEVAYLDVGLLTRAVVSAVSEEFPVNLNFRTNPTQIDQLLIAARIATELLPSRFSTNIPGQYITLDLLSKVVVRSLEIPRSAFYPDLVTRRELIGW